MMSNNERCPEPTQNDFTNPLIAIGPKNYKQPILPIPPFLVTLSTSSRSSSSHPSIPPLLNLTPLYFSMSHSFSAFIVSCLPPLVLLNPSRSPNPADALEIVLYELRKIVWSGVTVVLDKPFQVT